ncbi:MAG: tetratricopeptide repeat protein, partial [Bacteroidetes bacterium]|nr:tetratricopeptide repeat protein [Bacteroidota bacterium]
MDFKKLNDIDALNAKSLQLRYSNTSQALLFAEEALKYSTEINDEKWLAISKLNKLWCLFLQSDFNDIIDELIKPTFYFSDSGLESYRAEALLLTAQVQEGYGDYENSAINAYKALELFQNNSVEWGKIQTLSLIGSIQARLGEYKNSINTFTNCLEQRTKINDLPALASTHNQIARSYLLNNDFENAEKHYKE